jgi:hypothetical protein
MKARLIRAFFVLISAVILGAPAFAAPDQTICFGVAVPPGWITIGFVASSSCPASPGQPTNARTIRDLTALSANNVQSACADGVPIPAGWVVTSVTFTGVCGGTSATNNVNVIQNVNGESPSFFIDVCFTSNIPPEWIVTNVFNFAPHCPSPTSAGNQRRIKWVLGEPYLTTEVMCPAFTPAPDGWLTVGSPQPNANCGQGASSQTIQSNVFIADSPYFEVPLLATTTAGSPASYAINITNAFPGGVTFTVAGLPAGAHGFFNPASLPSGSGSTTLTVTTSTAAPPGTSTFTITGSGGGVSITQNATLTVNPPPDPTPPLRSCGGVRICLDQ